MGAFGLVLALCARGSLARQPRHAPGQAEVSAQQGKLQQPATPEQVLRAASPYIDVHAHLDPHDASGSLQAAVKAMRAENAARIIFLPSPDVANGPERYDSEILVAAEKKFPGKFAFLGGGGTLNAIIQEAVHTVDVGPEVQRKFKERAEEIVRQGASGFGEMAAEHFPSSTPYQYAPPDHPLFLLLADIAAEHNLPIDLHMDAVPTDMAVPSDLKSPPNPPRLHANIAAFERLLAHNPRAKIVWAHAGWDNTGYRTAELCRTLLKAHPNLYMEIKVDPLAIGKNSPLVGGASGAIKPEWLALFRDFPDRFVMGTDQHYPEPKQGPQRWQADILLFNQLPAALREKIGVSNPIRIYSLGTLNTRQ